MLNRLCNTQTFTFVLLVSMTYSFTSVANEAYEYLSEKSISDIKAGQTIEFLLMSEGEPDDVLQSLPDGEHFESYYYRNLNLSFVVNNETGYICGVASGKHQGNCQPNIELTEAFSRGVYLGMPVNEALWQLPHYTADKSTLKAKCYYLSSNQASTDVELMISDDKVVRFDVTSPSPLITKEEVGIGSTTQSILAAYPNAARKPHPYLGNSGEYLIVKLPSGNGIVFEVELNKVAQFRLGHYPEVEFIEGCN